MIQLVISPLPTALRRQRPHVRIVSDAPISPRNIKGLPSHPKIARGPPTQSMTLSPGKTRGRSPVSVLFSDILGRPERAGHCRPVYRPVPGGSDSRRARRPGPPAGGDPPLSRSFERRLARATSEGIFWKKPHISLLQAARIRPQASRSRSSEVAVDKRKYGDIPYASPCTSATPAASRR